MAIEARHEYTGAELFFLYSKDEENLFAAAFRTPPPDNTGVPHILEHSVLGGSRKYPVKEPFVELLKMSMATFINAMTYPDKTVYPVASNVEQDFFNLMDVYCDAVLHPNITPVTLRQEGHHLAFTRPGDLSSPLTIKGIVYNEMKGAYSDLDSLVERTSSQFLFPDTPYGLESGGTPEAIPALTYTDFKDYYERYYHPANGKFFIHSCIAPEKILSFLDARLQAKSVPPENLDSTIPYQTRRNAPREESVPYPIAASEDPQGKAAVTINWLTGDLAEPLTDLAMEVLDRLMLGHAGAPLHKALVDSQLGHDLTSSGYDNGRKETTFHVGLKGVDLGAKDDVVKCIEETLEKIAEVGFSKAEVERALHQFEYAHREIQSQYPLRLMDWVYSSWLYDYDPVMYLEPEAQLEKLWAHYEANPDCFSKLIKEKLLANPHRVTVLLKPVPRLQQERETALREQLEKIRVGKSKEELEAIDFQAQALEKLQSKPNSPEDVERLPQLGIGDVPAEPRHIPAEMDYWNSSPPLILPSLATNDVNYLMVAFNLRGLPEHLWKYVPLFSVALTQLGTSQRDYAQMAELIAENTGSLQAQAFVGVGATEHQELLTYLSIGLKTLQHTLKPALDIIHELLFELNVDDDKHLYDVVKQTRERAISQIIPGGHRIVARHAARHQSPAAAVSAVFSGMTQVRLVDRLAADFEQEKGVLKQALSEIRKFLVQGDRISASFSGPSEHQPDIHDWLGTLNGGRTGQTAVAATAVPDSICCMPRNSLNEGLTMEADVAYCATVLPAPHVSDPRSAPLQVLAHMLSFGYLWEEIRAKGGAYGGLCHYNSSHGTLALMSYRDPHIARTLQVYRQLLDYVRTNTWAEKDIQRAIIGCAREHEKPIRPAWATNAALWRQVGGFSPEFLNMQRRQLLAVSPEQVKEVALDVLESGFRKASTCVLASPAKLNNEMSQLDTPLEVQPVLAERR
ncbi:MAG: insulinase family protein [Lentisphaeria bacterium]